MPSAASATNGSRLPLLDLDPELARSIPAPEREALRPRLTVPVFDVPTGHWQPPSARADPDFGMLVVEGELTRTVFVDTARAVELLGPGDLIRPWQEDECSFSAVRWQVASPARVAALDGAIVRAIARSPALLNALLERVLRRSRASVAVAAASNLVGVEKRIVAILWQLSERWGRIEDGRVELTITLTHQQVADLVGARRPSVTTALSSLVAAGRLEASADGCWALRGDPPTVATTAPQRLT